MHIGVICDPRSFHTKKWAGAIQEAGTQVTVFSFWKDPCDSIPTVYIPPRGGKVSFANYLLQGRDLREALIEHKVDVVNPVNITPFGVWAYQAGIQPMVSVAMGSDILEYPPNRGHASVPMDRYWTRVEEMSFIQKQIEVVKWHVFRHMVKKSLHASLQITGDNMQLVESVRDWFDVPKEKVHLNRWGIEEELFEASEEELAALRKHFGIKEGQKVVLSPRGMKPIYQGDIIIRAFANLLEQGDRETKFIMLSAGYEIPQSVKELASRLSVEYANFHYEAGLIDRKQMCQLWKLVDVFISAPVYDGYSNSLSEGRYAGAIPVVNAIPANKEIAVHGEHVWFVDPFEPKPLSEMLSNILEDTDGHKEICAIKNREWVLDNAHLRTNIRRFIELCSGVMGREKELSNI